MNQEIIKNALRNVFDPHTGQDIVAMNMLQSVTVEGLFVNITLSLSAQNNEFKADLNAACEQAVQDVFPGGNVNIHFMLQNPHEILGAKTPLPQIKNIIAVASGKGGVGKSTVSTNLAFALQDMGAKVGLLDADLYGPSIPTMLGLQGQRPKVQDVYGKPRLIPLTAAGGMPVMSIGFIIEPEQAVVLRGPRLAGIIKQFLEDTIWEPLDYLIIDLPPGTGDIQLTLVQTVPLTGVVLVTTPQEVAVIDAVKAMNMFMLAQVDVPILGVVENMSWFSPEELPDHKYYIFGEGGGKKLTKMANSMLLGQVPLVQGIREASDMGKPIVLHNEPITKKIFMNIAQNLVQQVQIRHEALAPTQTVKMTS